MSKSCRLMLVGWLLLACGCVPTGPTPSGVHVWGRRGLDAGRFQRPRAIAIDDQQQLYIVDMTGRIQVFDVDGNLIRFWRTPEVKNGKPCGMEFSHDGKLMVSDTHYHRVLFYEPDGPLIPERTLGGKHGRGLGEFGFVTETVQDSRGNYYVAEYGDYARIQKFTPAGEPLLEWGGHGSEPGQFLRPQGLAVDAQDQLWVADASNHRIQIFDVSGDRPRFVRMWGEPGNAIGQLRYPYDLFLDGQGHVYVCEFGNQRIQKFTLNGESLGVWGGPGREPARLNQPWDMCPDAQGRIHVLDSYNHRVQRFRWTDSAVSKEDHSG